MNSSKEVMYIYNGDEENAELEFDEDGDRSIPPDGTFMTRHGKEWKIERTRIQTGEILGTLPVLKIDLSDRFEQMRKEYESEKGRISPENHL